MIIYQMMQSKTFLKLIRHYDRSFWCENTVSPTEVKLLYSEINKAMLQMVAEMVERMDIDIVPPQRWGRNFPKIPLPKKIGG